MRMLFKHVSRVFLAHKVLTFMLGIVLLLSSFIYTFISMGIGSVEDASDAYFEANVQEDLAIATTPALTAFDEASADASCPLDDALDLPTLSRMDRTCHDAVVESRISRMNEIAPSMTYEARYFKDLSFENGDPVRIMTMNEHVNIPRIEAGSMPGDGDMAVSRAYAEANGIAVGDTLEVNGQSYEVSAFVLFPDYTLPVFDDPLMFNSRMQTPALVNDATFESFDAFTGVHVGAAGEDAEASRDALEGESLSFVDSVLLTGNVMRSGAVYAEIQGSQMMALTVAVFTAATGIGVAGAFISRMIERSKKPLGVLIALGMSKRSVILAHLAFLSVASLGFILAGYVLGFYLSPSIRDMFLSFYILPKEPVTFSPGVFALSVGVPLAVLNGMGWWMLYRLFKRSPDALMRNRVKMKGMLLRPGSRRFLRLPFTFRMQIAFLSRHAGKTLLYMAALFTVFYMAIVTVGMVDTFGKTLPAYYESTHIESIGRCDPTRPCPADEGVSKVFESSGRIEGEQGQLIGIAPSDPIHPLENASGDDLGQALEEGAVITEGFKLLSGLEMDDTLTITHGDETLEVTVTGVADLYAGSRVFIERSELAEFFTGDKESYNTVYADHVLDEDDYLQVHDVDTILEQVESMDGLMQAFINITVGLSLALGGLVVYLITRLSADDHAYTIAMLKVIGYKNRQIASYLLGGYLLLSVIAFLLAIPPALLTHRLMSAWLADSFGMVIPLAIPWGNVFIIMVIYGMIYAIGIQSARRTVEKLPLSEALKRTQM